MAIWGRPGFVLSYFINYQLPAILTFADGTDASPGAILPANTCGRTNNMEALETSEMDLMPN